MMHPRLVANTQKNHFELVGYHGTSREIANRILLNNNKLLLSENSYDWLGSGIYFWLFSPERAGL